MGFFKESPIRPANGDLSRFSSSASILFWNPISEHWVDYFTKRIHRTKHSDDGRSGAVCTHRDRHFLADQLTLFSSSCGDMLDQSAHPDAILSQR
jgi:hypothetical protein